MPGDDLLSQLQRLSDNAKSLFTDILNGGQATEEAIVGALHGAVDQLNNIFDFNLEMPGLAKAKPTPRAALTISQRVYQWTTHNRGKAVVLAAFFLTGAVGLGLSWSRARSRRSPRKAKRTKHGARKEVVVLIGNPRYSPVLRSLALDMELKGFIVFVVVSSQEDILAVQKEARMDIKPLHIRQNDSVSAQSSIQQFHDLLHSKQQTIANISKHQLELCGLVIAPELAGNVKRIDHISSDTWTDFMTTKVNSTISLVSSFLPLVIEHQARIVMVTPSIVQSLSPALHSMEATGASTLGAYARSLRRELSSFGVKVSHLRLGAIDLSPLQPSLQAQRGRSIRGSPSIVLHNAIFDALTMKSVRGVQRIGQGASIYGAIADYAPSTLVDWIMSPSTRRMSSLLT